MTRIDAGNGVTWNVEDGGEGLPLLAIHGFTGSAATWRSFRPAWPGTRLVAVDLVGHGGSDSPPSVGPFGVDATVAAIETVLDRLEIQRAVVLGYSLGGRIALHFAVAHPDRVSALILESSTPGIADEPERRKRREDDDRLAASIESDGLEAFVDYWQALPLWASQARLPEERRSALRQLRLRNNATGLANSLRGSGTGACDPLYDRLGEIAVPTLVIAGELDARYVALAEVLGRGIPAARVRVIPGVGHATHFEDPAAFGATVGEFLAEVQERAALEVRA